LRWICRTWKWRTTKKQWLEIAIPGKWRTNRTLSSEFYYNSTDGTETTVYLHEFASHVRTLHRSVFLLTSQPTLVTYSLHLPTEGWPGWVDLGGWLHSEMVYPSAVTVAHPCTGRARRWLTSLMRSPTLTTKPKRHLSFRVAPAIIYNTLRCSGSDAPYRLIFYLKGCQTNDKIGRFYLPTKSRDKNLSCVMQKSPDFVGQDRARSILDDFVGRLFIYRTTNFAYVAMVIVYNGRWIFISVISCVCYYFRSLDAEKVMQVLFCDLHSAVVLADNVWSSRQNSAVYHGSPISSADFVRQLNHTHKSRPTLSFVWHPL